MEALSRPRSSEALLRTISDINWLSLRGWAAKPLSRSRSGPSGHGVRPFP